MDETVFLVTVSRVVHQARVLHVEVTYSGRDSRVQGQLLSNSCSITR